MKGRSLPGRAEVVWFSSTKTFLQTSFLYYFRYLSTDLRPYPTVEKQFHTACTPDRMYAEKDYLCAAAISATARSIVCWTLAIAVRHLLQHSRPSCDQLT